MTETEIIREVQNDRIELFDNLVKQYQTNVYYFVLSVVRNEADADEITQEAFVKAFLNIKKFKFRSSFKTWVMSIALNEAKHVLKKKKYYLDLSHGELLNISDQRGQKNDQEDIKMMFRLINKEILLLPKQQQLIFLMRANENKTLKEIAKELHLSEGTIKSHLNRVFTKLRKKFYTQYKTLFEGE